MDENSVRRQKPAGNSRSSTGCQNIGKVFLMIINILSIMCDCKTCFVYGAIIMVIGYIVG